MIVLGDGNGTSTVANAGPVSPALISPPRPLDLLRARTLVVVFGAERGGNASLEVEVGTGETGWLPAAMSRAVEEQAARFVKSDHLQADKVSTIGKLERTHTQS